MPQTKKKSEKLYHSNLRDWGPTDIAFKGEVRDGKYGPYCFVRVKGEAEDRLFTVDSPAVREEIERIRKVADDGFVQVAAHGAKDAAVLEVVGLTPAPDSISSPAASPPDRNGPPPNEWPEDTEPVDGEQATMEEVMERRLWGCLQTTGNLWERFHKEFNRYPSEQEQKVAVTLFIQGR